MMEIVSENVRTDVDPQSASAPSEPAEPTGEAPPAASAPAMTWEELGLSQASLDLLAKAGFTRPTPIQCESIPAAIEGHDLIASAQTGTGKTASFVLPMVERFAGKEGTFGLILAPTREIAQQIQTTLELFANPQGLRSIVLIGGIDMKIDAKALQTYPQIIVATPGRLCDHLDRGNIWLDFIQVVVLDEADRMLDMGFSDQLNRIMQEVPNERQTLIFSATFPPTVENLARKVLYEPKRIAIGKPTVANASVEQRFRHVGEDSKPREFMRLLREEKGTIIVFTRSKDGATRLWRWLHSNGVYDATFIHSDRTQSDRELALKEFKEGKYRILIATDVAARGIHVDNVAHVINYELPMEPEDYIHRIGRTGRQGATGISTTFITPKDRRTVALIEKLLGKKIPGGAEAEPRMSAGNRPAQPVRPLAGNRPKDAGRAIEPRQAIGGRDQAVRNVATNHAPRPEGSVGEGDPKRRRRRRRGGRGGATGSGSAPGGSTSGGSTPPPSST